MDTKSTFEITGEQRILLNAGHGPPLEGPVTQDLYNKGSRMASNFQKSSSEMVYNPDNMSAVLRACDGSQRMMMVLPPGVVAQGFVVPCFIESGFSDVSSRETGKANDEQIWRVGRQPKRDYINKDQIDVLQKQSEELHLKLALKSEEVDDLKTKLHQLTQKLNDLPDISLEDLAGDRLIQLTATNETTGKGCWTEKSQKDEDNDMMKSVQCSELSVEQSCRIEEGESAKGGFEDGRGLHLIGREASSASGSSFEVVGHGLCSGPELFAEEEREQKKSDNEWHEDLKQEKKFDRGHMLSLESKIKTLEAGLTSEKLLRVESEARINKKLEELSANVICNVGARDRGSEMQDLSRLASELTAAEWKLTELNRENENLREMEQEWGSRATTIRELEEDLKRQSEQMTELQNQLKAERQLRVEAEARIEELELDQRNFIIQQSTDATVVATTTENALLKHQISTYKEDFEIERRDREKLISERDTLQRYYETLRSDLDNARQQLRKYEGDIATLRNDNSSMRTKLREASERLSCIQDSETVPANAPHAFSKQIKTSIQTTNLALPKPAAMSAVNAGWKCRACTFDNPSQRSCCEMCGTANESKSSATSKTGACAQGLSAEAAAGRHWTGPLQSTPLLSNLRNYGDIETD